MTIKIHRIFLILTLALVMTSGSFYVSKAESSNEPLWVGHPSAIWRVEHVNPTCTTDGYHREGIWCQYCEIYKNGSIEKEETYPSFGGHTEGDPVEENYNVHPCLGGSYDSVVRCSVCEEELSRETIDVKGEGHTNCEPVEENLVEATCTEDGSYDEVIYCSVCEEELSREPQVIKAGHLPCEEWETELEATTEEEGSEICRCSRCEEVLDRRPIAKIVVPPVDPGNEEPGNDNPQVNPGGNENTEDPDEPKKTDGPKPVTPKPPVKDPIQEPVEVVVTTPLYVTVGGVDDPNPVMVDEAGNAVIEDFFMKLAEGSNASETVTMEVGGIIYVVTRYADGTIIGQLPPNFSVSGRDLIVSNVKEDIDINVISRSALGGGVSYDPDEEDFTEHVPAPEDGSVVLAPKTPSVISVPAPTVEETPGTEIAGVYIENNNSDNEYYDRGNTSRTDINVYAESLLSNLTGNLADADKAAEDKKDKAEEKPSASSFFKEPSGNSDAGVKLSGENESSPSKLLIAVDVALISALILGIGVLWKLGILKR